LFLVSDDSFYFWDVAPIPKQSKKDGSTVSFFLVFPVPVKSSAGNFIESISCRGSAVLVSKTACSARANVARLIADINGDVSSIYPS